MLLNIYILLITVYLVLQTLNLLFKTAKVTFKKSKVYLHEAFYAKKESKPDHKRRNQRILGSMPGKIGSWPNPENRYNPINSPLPVK